VLIFRVRAVLVCTVRESAVKGLALPVAVTVILGHMHRSINSTEGIVPDLLGRRR
jgi:hypothetical protein